MQKEPTYGGAVIQSVIGAGIALGVGFGLNWTGEQVALVTAFTSTFIPFVIAALTRQIVWSPASVNAIVTQAATTGQIPSNTPSG